MILNHTSFPPDMRPHHASLHRHSSWHRTTAGTWPSRSVSPIWCVASRTSPHVRNLILPYPTLPYPTLPYSTLPYPTLPYTTLHYPTLLYYTLLYSTLPNPTYYPTLPYLLPYPTLPYPDPSPNPMLTLALC